MEDDRFSARHSHFSAHCRRRPNFMTRAAKGSKYDNIGGPESWLEGKKEWWLLIRYDASMHLDVLLNNFKCYLRIIVEKPNWTRSNIIRVGHCEQNVINYYYYLLLTEEVITLLHLLFISESNWLHYFPLLSPVSVFNTCRIKNVRLCFYELLMVSTVPGDSCMQANWEHTTCKQCNLGVGRRHISCLFAEDRNLFWSSYRHPTLTYDAVWLITNI